MPAKNDAIAVLKEDHKKVKELFDAFEEAKSDKEKKNIAGEAIRELKVHAAVEEKLFYPALRQEMEDGEDILEEADEEHHVAKVLIAELEEMTGDEDNWEAKFLVLAENVRHHVKEEEGEMFPEAKKTDIDFAALGTQLLALKEQYTSEGVPPDAEREMVAKAGLRGDSPAKSAMKSVDVPLKEKAAR